MDLRDQLQASLGTAYTLERELGGGGMSRVFLAEETALGRKVVVKVLAPELGAGVNADRFNREVQLAARLQQAQIVPVLAAGELDGVPYYTMPYVEGESLRARIAREGPLPIAEVVSIIRDVARALAYAHERGVVHRDIKPDNVLLSGGSAVVTDFGIAKAISVARADAADSALTQLGTSVGTPAYVSPEQAAGDPNVDHRADIYSLGCMAYELLTGSPPFAGRPPQRVLAAHLTEAPRPVAELRPDTPPALAALVMQCLAKEPAARPQTAGEFLTRLDAATTPDATTTATLLSAPGSRGRTAGLYALLAVAVAVVAKAAVIAFGIPGWVFPAAVVLMLIGLPVVLVRRTLVPVAWALGALAVAVAAVMVLRLFGIGPAGSLLAAGKMEERERLLVIDFDAGKDSSLSHVVTEAVRTNLGQSRVVAIMPPTAVAAALQRMTRPATSRIDLGLAREIAQREGVKAIVDGVVTPIGAGYLVGISLIAADSGNTLASFQTTIDGPGELLDALDGLTRKLRARIGESLKTVRDAPALEEVTTPSLEALKKYAEAERAFDLDADYKRAVVLLRDAVTLDTTFAMAYRKLGVSLSNTGRPAAEVDSALTRAYRFRDHLTERERDLATATYFDIGPGHDRVKAADAYRRALALDSTDLVATNNLANILRQRRQFAAAESLFRRGVAAHPNRTNYTNLAGVLVDRGKLAAAESAAVSMARRAPDPATDAAFTSTFLYLRGQIDSAQAVYGALRKSPDANVRLAAVSNLFYFDLLHGRVNDAMDLSRQAGADAARLGFPADPLSDSLRVALIASWFFGHDDAATRTLDHALASAPLDSRPAEQRPYLTLANAYALAHRPDRARAMVAEFDAAVRDSAVRVLQGPLRHGALAEILIAEHRPRDAVGEIWKADSLPDGPAGHCATCLYGDLGRAFDLAEMPDSAISYWERYLAAPIMGRWLYDGVVLAGIHKRLGELYEAKGDRARALSHYTAFVNLWRDADPELQPKVREVKARIARLREPAAS